MISFYKNYKDILLITFLGVIFFIPFLGGVHLFDWDEINFAEISREMIVTDTYLRLTVNFQPFWEKPPFFFWLQVLAMKTFGINEFSARFPNAVFGILSLLVLYLIGKKLKNSKFGLIWALIYLGSILPHLYFKSGIIDPVFNLLIFLGLYFFILFYWKKENIIASKHSKGFYIFLSGSFIGLAVLTKGPVGYLLPLLTWGVYWIMKKFRFYVSIPQFFVISLIALAATFAWFGLETVQHGPWFVETFTRYQFRLFSTQDAGHGGFPGYHFVVILIGCFPASVFAIRGFYKFDMDTPHLVDFRKWMIILFWVVLILFTIVQSKIVHYSSLAYFPLTFMAAIVIEKIIAKKLHFNRWMQFGVIALGSIYAIMTIVMPFLARKTAVIKPLFAKDPFAMANLEADVHWSGWESVTGLVLLVVVVLAVIFMKQGRLWRGVVLLFIGTAFFVNITLIFFIARIEGYSQNAAVEFCKTLQGKDCYITTSGYKSYVHYFYPRIQPHTNVNSIDKNWLLTGDIDKEVYILTKIHRADDLRKYPDVEEIGSKNGFVFFRRVPADVGGSGFNN
jgi:4-amino-4-deoxy-L-arabinose transferase-like glycosyltransferase